ncbi:MAG: hypothetical protein R2909_13945 [Gemmatimonadales bacterium]
MRGRLGSAAAGLALALAASLPFAPLDAQSRPIRQAAIDAALLPLPAALRPDARVIAYTDDGPAIVLREGSNGMVCAADRADDDRFDVRCYHESFMPVIERRRELARERLDWNATAARIDADVKAGRLHLPESPTAGYRMLGPIAAFDWARNRAGPEIARWQSIHFPYKTAVELGLPTEPDGNLPYAMLAGTYWSHVMINAPPE